MKIKKDSWHYRLIDTFLPFNLEEGMSSCQYRWSLFKALLFALLSAVAFVALVIAVTVSAFVIPFIDNLFPVSIIPFVLSWGIILLVIYEVIRINKDKLPQWMSKSEVKIKKKKDKGFISQSLEEIKNKFCSKVEFMD